MGSYWAIASVCFLVIGCLTALTHEALLKRRLSPRISIAPTFLALCATLALYISSNSNAVRATLFAWNSTPSPTDLPIAGGTAPSFSISIAYYVDVWASLLAIVAVFLGLCAQMLLATQTSENHSEPNWTNICVYGALTALLNLLYSASLVMLLMSWFAIGIIVYLFLTAENQHIEPAEANVVREPSTEMIRGASASLGRTNPSLAPSQRMFVIKQLVGYSFLGGVLFVARAGDVEPVSVSLQSAWLSLAPSILIALGLGAYLGLYPFNAWPSYAARYSAAASISLSLFPAIASVYLLGRLYPALVAGAASPLSNILLFMALATIIIASLRVWRAMDFNTLLTSVASVELGFVALAFALAPLHNGDNNASGIIDVNAFSAGTLILLNCVLAAQAIVQVGMRLLVRQGQPVIPGTERDKSEPEVEGAFEQRQKGVMLSRLRVALLVAPWMSLIGLPFTLGFVAKSILFAVSFTFPHVLVWPTVGVANVLVIIAVVRFMDRLLFGEETIAPSLSQSIDKASNLWLLTPWIIVLLLGLMPNQAMRFVLDPALRAILGESAKFGPPEAVLTGSPLFAITIAVTLALIILAFYLYPVPLARLTVVRGESDQKHKSLAVAAELRYTILETLVDITALVVGHLSALDGVLKMISRWLRRVSVTTLRMSEAIHENYYFPSLAVLSIILIFIFLG